MKNDMRLISKRTWVLGLLTLLFFVLVEYCQWRTGCGPKWLSHVHAQDLSEGVFMPDPCEMWREMPLLDKVGALGLFGFGVAFVFSLMKDIFVWARLRKTGRKL